MIIPYELLLVITVTIGTFAAAMAGTKLYISWSSAREILDVPNERSSHVKPVPVGAGAVVTIVALTAYGLTLFFIGAHEKLLSIYFAYPIAAALIVAVSWLDDRRGVSAAIRFAVQVVSGILVVVVFVARWGTTYSESVMFLLLALFVVLGLTNVFNFMDGIDGMAGTQAIVAGAAWGIVGQMLGAYVLSFLGFAIAGSMAGFLWYNWQPAKVFLGDSGSAFLGFSFGVMPLLMLLERRPVQNISGPENEALVVVASVCFVWPFALDSGITLIRRILNLEKVWRGHRTHLYQRLVTGGISESTVSLLYGALAVVSGLTTSLFLLDKIGLFAMLLGPAAVSAVMLAFRLRLGSSREDPGAAAGF